MATQPAVEILLLECKTSMRDVADISWSGEDAMAMQPLQLTSVLAC